MQTGTDLLLSSAYLAPVAYYAALYAAGRAFEERCDHYVKQTYRNRCIIAGANGPLSLTLPVVRKGNNQPMADVELSRHGDWPHLHWNALVSAYENSPYFEFYADDFRPFYEHPPRRLIDFNEGLRRLVCDLLQLTPDVRPTLAYAPAPDGLLDLRERISPKARTPLPCAEYYQVFRTRHGFLPGLSIADLLFNMGPESRLVLRRTAELLPF